MCGDVSPRVQRIPNRDIRVTIDLIPAQTAQIDRLRPTCAVWIGSYAHRSPTIWRDDQWNCYFVDSVGSVLVGSVLVSPPFICSLDISGVGSPPSVSSVIVDPGSEPQPIIPDVINVAANTIQTQVSNFFIVNLTLNPYSERICRKNASRALPARRCNFMPPLTKTGVRQQNKFPLDFPAITATILGVLIDFVHRRPDKTGVDGSHFMPATSHLGQRTPQWKRQQPSQRIDPRAGKAEFCQGKRTMTGSLGRRIGGSQSPEWNNRAILIWPGEHRSDIPI